MKFPHCSDCSNILISKESQTTGLCTHCRMFEGPMTTDGDAYPEKTWEETFGRLTTSFERHLSRQ